jgi:hypothetical protein
MGRTLYSARTQLPVLHQLDCFTPSEKILPIDWPPAKTRGRLACGVCLGRRTLCPKELSNTGMDNIPIVGQLSQYDLTEMRSWLSFTKKALYGL